MATPSVGVGAACPDKRFTTYERVELQLPQVVKKNGSRTDYDRDKLKASMMLAMRKRPVTTESIEAALDRIEEKLVQLGIARGGLGPHRRVGDARTEEASTRWPTSASPVYPQFRGRRRVFRRDPGNQEAAASAGALLKGDARVSFSTVDHASMARDLQLARRGLNTTTPNPRVGCVLVRDGHVARRGLA